MMKLPLVMLLSGWLPSCEQVAACNIQPLLLQRGNRFLEEVTSFPLVGVYHTSLLAAGQTWDLGLANYHVLLTMMTTEQSIPLTQVK